MSKSRIVITGIGVVSPLGLDLVTFWEALLAGRSGVHSLPSLDGFPVRFGAEVERFDARNYLEKKDRKRLSIMVRTIQFSVASAQLAMDDAHIDRDSIDPCRFGVLFGSGTVPSEFKDLGSAGQECAAGPECRTVGPTQPMAEHGVGGDGWWQHSDKETRRQGDKEKATGAFAPCLPVSLSPCLPPDRIDMHKWGAKGLPKIPPMWMLSHIPNMMASHVSILQNAQGPNNTITQGELGATLAVGEAMRGIRNGRASLFLVGGCDTLITPISFVRNILFGNHSQRNNAPEKACRPFDLRRDGRVLGEGGGVLVVEEAEHALRRGARIYAEVVGFGAACGLAPAGTGASARPRAALVRAIRIALSQARIAPGDIDHINAHGTSTHDDDACEARALVEVFGQPTPPVLAMKSYFGLLGAGSAPVELAGSLLALENGLLPATLNYEYPDPACPVNVSRVQQPVRKPYFLKVTQTELGQAAAIVCRKWGT